MQLNSLKQLGALLKKPIDKDLPVNGVAVDSRLVEKGNIFFALAGQKVDGHQFLEVAVKKGATCLVVNKNYEGQNFGVPLIKVDNTLIALQNLSRDLLALRKSKVVAITGSVGKTTTKEFLATILKEKYRVAKTPGNANSQIGLPLALLNHTNGSEDVLVLEMGMNEPGQLKKLIEIAPPDIAVLTHVALTHAANFHSLEEIGLEKAEIFKSPKTKVGIINHDIENSDRLMQIGSCRKIPFSVFSRGAEFYLDNFTIHTLNKGTFHLTHELHPFLKRHHYQNLLAAIAAATELGVSAEEITRAESKLELPENRFEVVEKEGVTFVNDSYNASEVSMIAALESLPKPKSNGKTIAVLGEMLELGKFSAACHKRVGETALKYVDQLFLLGNECKPIFECWKENRKPVEWFLELRELEKALQLIVKRNDVVLLKGSRANHLWEVLNRF